MQAHLPAAFRKIVPAAPGVYIVGGCIRDWLLGRRPADYDIAVAGDPGRFASRTARALSGHTVYLAGAGHPLFRVVSSTFTVDVTRLDGVDIFQDLSRRDFTVNAMAYDTEHDRLIDPHGGQADLAEKKIRAVGETVFEADPLRLLRAFRLAATLNFDITPATLAAITAAATRIGSAAAERIREELRRLFTADSAAEQLAGMKKTGLMFTVFPELAAARRCPQPPAHSLDVLGHILETIRRLDTLLGGRHRSLNLPEGLPENIVEPPCHWLLKFAALYHDAGKPAVFHRGPDNRIRFSGHAGESVRMAEIAAKRLRFSNREAGYIHTVIKNHMRPMMLFTAHRKGTLTLRGIHRFFRAAGPLTPDILMHNIADTLAKHSDGNFNRSLIAFTMQLLTAYRTGYRPMEARPLLITGHDLIEEFGWTPSARFKSVLQHIRSAQTAGLIRTRQEALAAAKAFTCKKAP